MFISRTIISIFILASVFYFGFVNGNNYKNIHFDAIVIDAHNDVTGRIVNGEDISKRTNHGHSDLVRFKEGGLDVEIFSIWVPPQKTTRSYFHMANQQIDSVESFVKRNPSQVEFAKSSQEIKDIIKQGKFVVMLGLEGGHPIDNDLKNLEHFYQRGVRYMALTWNNSTDWATSSKDENDSSKKLKRKGLSKLGRQIIRRMNELGMIVDISHTGEQTFWDVIKTSKKPVIASHSSVWTICKHHRNLKDDQIRAIAKNGGVVCINFAPFFVDSTFAEKEKVMRERNKARIDSFRTSFKGDDHSKDSAITESLKGEYLAIRPPLSVLIDHFDYVAKLVGVDFVGIGSDFDGISITPLEMDDVTFLPNITRELLNRGYSEVDVKKILGENFLRVLRAVEVR